MLISKSLFPRNLTTSLSMSGSSSYTVNTCVCHSRYTKDAVGLLSFLNRNLTTCIKRLDSTSREDNSVKKKKLSQGVKYNNYGLTLIYNHFLNS